MDSGNLVSDKLVLKLLEDRLYASDSMINGWILTGFPKNSSQLSFLLEANNNIFKPSLIAIMDLDDEYVTKRSSYRRIDPTTGKVYYIDSPNFEEINKEISKKLVFKNEDKEDVFQKRLENFKKSPNFPDNLDNIILRLNGESGIDSMVERISDAMENATL